MIAPSTEITTRDEFALLCNWRNLLGIAVEVGVEHGEFAAQFLSNWLGRYWVGVDNYSPSPFERTGDYEMALHRLMPHSRRAKLVKSESTTAAKLFASKDIHFGNPGAWAHGKPDFVYIDADHRYQCVKADLEAWWKAISAIGILAGHDFAPEHPGVVQAVTDFAKHLNVHVYLTRDAPASWYIYKSGMPGADWKRC
jgi:Methyltransferase domain